MGVEAGGYESEHLVGNDGASQAEADDERDLDEGEERLGNGDLLQYGAARQRQLNEVEDKVLERPDHEAGEDDRQNRNREPLAQLIQVLAQRHDAAEFFLWLRGVGQGLVGFGHSVSLADQARRKPRLFARTILTPR